MMRSIPSLTFLIFLFHLNVNTSALAAASCKAFEPEERLTYINETSEQIPKKASLQKLAAAFLVPFGYGTPTLFRGMMMSVDWERDGSLRQWRPRAVAEFDSWFGRGTMVTQAGDADSLWILFNPAASDRIMNPEQMRILRHLYPGLIITPLGRSPFDLESPSRILLQLFQEAIPEGESFETTARSLVNTVFNDPQGVLGLRPSFPYVPKDLLKLPALKDEIDFLYSFGSWSPIANGETHAARRPADARLLGTGISVNVNERTMIFSLQTSAFHAHTLANVRRIVQASLDSGFLSPFRKLPTTVIHGTSLVYVKGLPTTPNSIVFARRLDGFQNMQSFEEPLKGLLDTQKDEVRRWIEEGDLNQDGLKPNKIKVEDIVAANEI